LNDVLSTAHKKLAECIAQKDECDYNKMLDSLFCQVPENFHHKYLERFEAKMMDKNSRTIDWQKVAQNVEVFLYPNRSEYKHEPDILAIGNEPPNKPLFDFSPKILEFGPRFFL